MRTKAYKEPKKKEAAKPKPAAPPKGVWRQERQELAKTVAGNDVFDPMNYGEDEFGPEDHCPPKKKQQRKRKKDTKAILVFGKNKSKVVKKVVKETQCQSVSVTNFNINSDQERLKRTETKFVKVDILQSLSSLRKTAEEENLVFHQMEQEEEKPAPAKKKKAKVCLSNYVFLIF